MSRSRATDQLCFRLLVLRTIRTGQQVGMYLGTTAANGAVSSHPIELYLYDSAGLDGRGGSSYIDRTIYRDRDVNGLGSGGDGVLEERRYYLQNWRNDVVELIKTTGEIVERYRYDSYGRPSSFEEGDSVTVLRRERFEPVRFGEF